MYRRIGMPKHVEMAEVLLLGPANREFAATSPQITETGVISGSGGHRGVRWG
jgi:hypothetical protein